MIKRTIEISRQPAFISVRLGQLILQPPEADKSAAHAIPCEDIGLVMVDQPRVTWTHRALAELMKHGAAVCICGDDHLPAGLLLPLPGHSEVVWRIDDQINATRPRRKRIWQQLIAAKVRAQAANLEPGSPARKLLENLAGEVRSGDSTNVEAQAARAYWAAWLTDGPRHGPGAAEPGRPAAAGPALATSLTAEGGGEVFDADRPDAPRFRRDPDGLDPINIMLNYGYAVLRAAVARALVAAGLLPALGVHHHNRANAFCLADDLMEPLRPMVDARVRELHRRGHARLDQLTKACLLDVLVEPVKINRQRGPLMVSLHRLVASLRRCLRGTGRLTVPISDGPPRMQRLESDSGPAPAAGAAGEGAPAC